jgi:hypothetical protein
VEVDQRGVPARGDARGRLTCDGAEQAGSGPRLEGHRIAQQDVVDRGTDSSRTADGDQKLVLDGELLLILPERSVQHGRFFEGDGVRRGFLSAEAEPEEVTDAADGGSVEVHEPRVTDLYNYYVHVTE